MDPILDKVRGGQNPLEQLVGKIPGFRGYREREMRREADKLQRDYLASRLDEGKHGLNEVAAAATRSGSLDVINDVETARKRLDKVANRVRYADRGYSGFFDAMKVDEAVLDRVYQFDLGLVAGIEEIQSAIQRAMAEPAGAQEALRALVAKIDALDSHLSDREAILGGLK